MKTETNQREDVTLAPIVEALHTVYRDHLAPRVKEATGLDLPPAVMVVKRDARAWGHITVAPAWSGNHEELDTDYPYALFAIGIGAPMTVTVTDYFHEIMVSGENLSRGARDVFGTLAHEAAHAINIVAGVRDVDINGRHNRKFADRAEYVFGLTIEEAGWIGWSKTTVSNDCAKTWREAIDIIDRAILATSQHAPARGGTGGGFTWTGGSGGTSGGRNKNQVKGVCPCGKSIRAGMSTLDAGVMCKTCGGDFVAVGR
jgi:hypothetical protein